MQEMQSVFQHLKEAADSKVQIARLELFVWQKISSAMAEAGYLAKKSSDKKGPRINIREAAIAPTKTYVNVKEACQFLGVSRSTLYRLMSEGQIPYSKMGGHATRYNRQDLEAYAHACAAIRPSK